MKTATYVRLAHALSWALHPFLLPLYLVAALLLLTPFGLYPAGVKLYLVWVVVLYALVIPVLALGVLRSLGRISSYRIDERRERLLPLAVGTLCFLLCALTLGAVVFGKVMVVDRKDVTRRPSSCASACWPRGAARPSASRCRAAGR